MKLTRALLIQSLSLLVLLSGCRSAKVNDEKVIPAHDLYNSGLQALQEQRYKAASKEFEKVFFQHPGNIITPQAELMQAYSLYMENEYAEAIDILRMFIKLHPKHEDVSYAYYMIGLSNYMQISGPAIDQSRSLEAKEAFEELIKRFPSTKYAMDAALKIDLVNDHLAGHEMLVGRYYLNKNNPIAAIKRFQTVIDKYQTTSHSAEALHRLVEANMMLGLKDEAVKYAAMLGYNYPDSHWYRNSYDLLKGNAPKVKKKKD